MSEKILIICSVLEVTPYELLGGTDGIGSRNNPSEYNLVNMDSECGCPTRGEHINITGSSECYWIIAILHFGGYMN